MKIKYAERGVFVRFILLYPNLFCVYVEIILASLEAQMIECILIELYMALFSRKTNFVPSQARNDKICIC